MIHVMCFSSSFGAHGAYCSCKSMCRQLRARSNALTTACMLLTAPVSPQSLRRNTFVDAPPRHSKMEADRVCGLVIVWVYHQVAQPVAKIKSQGQPGSQHHPEHKKQAHKQPVVPMPLKHASSGTPLSKGMAHALSRPNPRHAQHCRTVLSAIPSLIHQNENDKRTLSKFIHPMSNLFRTLSKHTRR